MASVFLSYARDDLAKAEALAAALEKFGHRVWWDRSIEGGSRFAHEIEQALNSADVVVVLWSEASLQSAWVQDEAAEGRDTGRLVPVVIDNVKPPLGFRQFQAVDLSAWKLRGKSGAIEAVQRAILAKAGATDSAKPPKPVRSNRDYRRLAVAAAMLVLVVAGVLTYWLVRPPRQDPDALRLQIGDIRALTGEVPQTVPETLREETLSALATDAVIVASSEEPRGASKAGYALTASIRKAGDMLRFTVHLINEHTGATVWTDTLDRPASTADLAPRQVAVALSQVLRCGLGGAARYREPMPDDTLSIYMNFCEEYWADTAGKEVNPRRMVDLAHRLTAAAPNFSRGWSALAEVATWGGSESKLQSEEALRDEAIKAAEKALALDKENSEAYQALAGLQPPFAFAEREKLHVKSVSVRPSDCGCEYVGYGSFLSRVGRNSEAVDAYKRAHDMIPLSAEVNARLADGQFVVGRTEDADRTVRGVLELWPDYDFIRQVLVRSAFWTGRYEEALKLLADQRAGFSEPERKALAAAMIALRGRNAAAKAAAAQSLSGLSGDSALNRPIMITALAALGANDQALRLASEAISRDGPRALPLLFEPPFEAARRSPQFVQIAQRFGLIDYWRKSRRKPDFCKEASPPPMCARL